MFHDGQAVLGLLLLQIEHLPQLLQLLQLTEGLQHHQHGNQTEEEIHCGTQREERDGEMMECKLFTVFMLTFELKGVFTYQTFLCRLYMSVCVSCFIVALKGVLSSLAKCYKWTLQHLILIILYQRAINC